MALDQFMIAPYTSGLNKSVRPFLIPDDAFSNLRNAYVYRGRVRKRFGSRLISASSSLSTELTVKIGTTDGSGNISGTVPIYDSGTLGVSFTIGTDTFTVLSLGTPAIMTTNSGTATVYTFYTSGANIAQFDIQGSFAATNVFYTPLLSGFEQIQSRLRISLGNTDASGNIAGTATGYVKDTLCMFSIGGELFTVPTTGTPVTMITNSKIATVMTFNTTSGAYVINGANPSTECFFYPSNPVMGFTQVEDGSAVNEEPTYAFDTRMCYRYTSAGWVRVGTVLWTEDDSHFFWSMNYRGQYNEDYLLFVTNNSATDHIRYWDTATSTWTTFTPRYNSVATDVINGCRLIIPFKRRLLFLNTYEYKTSDGATNHHPNRVRFSQSGDGRDATLSFREDLKKAGWVDASTREEIMSAKLLRDRLIVFFERSTWELVYTGNQVKPFTFQRINSELGVESTFSTVTFDRDIIGVGNVGMHACNGANVTRIDEKIPDEVFQIHNENNGVERVCGIRDYRTEMVYWSIPAADTNPTYPNEILVYNYQNKTWALNDDTITAFGYLQNLNDTRWQDIKITWDEWTEQWDSPVTQAQFRQVIAGNQQGYTFIIDIGLPRNAAALQVSQMANTAGSVVLTVSNHNMVSGDFVLIENALGVTGVSGIYEIISKTDNTITINEPSFAGTYTGGATVARVSMIDILTKEFNFYFKQGKDFYVPKLDLHVDKTTSGEISIDYYASTAERDLAQDGFGTGTLWGDSVIETFAITSLEGYQRRIWRATYPQAEGQFIQLRLYFDGSQMTNENIALQDFQLHAMSFYTKMLERF